MAKRISPERLAELHNRGAKVKSTTLHLPKKEEAVPDPSPTPVPAPSISEEERHAIAMVAEQSNKALKAAVEASEKIAEKVELSGKQTEQVMQVLLEIEKERNKTKRAIVHREETGDRLIKSVEFITVK